MRRGQFVRTMGGHVTVDIYSLLIFVRWSYREMPGMNSSLIFVFHTHHRRSSLSGDTPLFSSRLRGELPTARSTPFK